MVVLASTTVCNAIREALQKVLFTPRYGSAKGEPQYQTTFLGQTFAAPFGVAPLGLSGLNMAPFGVPPGERSQATQSALHSQ